MTWGLSGVFVDYSSQSALIDVSISVERGSITAVVGGDGAGKSTVARTMVGLTRVRAGRVARPARIGFQPESSGVWADLTVGENLALVAGAHQMDDHAARERIDQLLAVTGLTEARDRLGGRLSGGMRQKLGVAMALLSDPDLLILDEPTTGLDPVSRLELWAFITGVVSQGKGVLLTTAYVEEAERAKSIAVLDEGRVLAFGSLSEVLERTPGELFELGGPLGPTSWRRGKTWRFWSPDGTAPENSKLIEPDLQDAVTVAAIAGQARN